VTPGDRLRAFLIDDEPLALRRLARLLHATGRVDIVGQATDPAQGLARLAEAPVDVLFLDIHMPGLSGFQVVERIPAGPAVVFTTAHDRHAVQAFEVNAADYLLKPVERARLDATLERVASRRAEPPASDLRATLERLAAHLRGGAFLDHVASKARDRVQLVPVEEVTHLVARHRATYAVTAAGEHMLDMTLLELERRLDPSRFFRIHRAVLVNLACVAGLRADEDGHLVICLKGAARAELPVSRDRVRALKERLGVA
jgi:two-component system, LytTR family, response regulator